MKLALVLGGLLFVSVSINMVMFAKLDKAEIELQTAINNQVVLERTIQEQNEQIIKVLESAKKTQAQIQNLNTQYSASQAQVTNLRNKFAKHNLEGMALAKPGLLQGKVNKATDRVMVNLTTITNPDQFDEKATDNTTTAN
jgi:transglutaminase/protease-like cytokinesis protein 3